MKRNIDEIHDTSLENKDSIAKVLKKTDELNNSSSENKDFSTKNENLTAKLPNETLLQSFRFLDLKSLFQSAKVSKRWYLLSNLARNEKCLEICQEYNLIFLNAVKEFCKAYEKEFKEKCSDESRFEDMKTCHYGDKTYYKLISIAASVNAKNNWIFNEKFLNSKEIVFFSNKNEKLYDKLLDALGNAVKAFIDDQQEAKHKPSQLFKNFIQEVAQLLIRWQCYLFRNTEGFKIEDEIDKVYKLIEQANDFIGKHISIDYLNENSRNKYLICLQLQLSDFGKNCQSLAYDESVSWSGDFNFTDLSGSTGLHRFIEEPLGEDNGYFADFEYCDFDAIAPELMIRTKNMHYTKAQKLSRDFASLNDLDEHFMTHNGYIYNLGIQSQQPVLQEKQTKIEHLQKRLKLLEQYCSSLEAKLNQDNPKSEEGADKTECSSNPINSL